MNLLLQLAVFGVVMGCIVIATIIVTYHVLNFFLKD